MMRGVVASVALLASVSAAPAYELLRVNHATCNRGDQNLHWRALAVGISVTPLPPPYNGLALEALERWNLSLSRFRFSIADAPPCTRDGVAAVSIADVPCGRDGFGDALAVTRSIWTSSGALVDADVTFRPDTIVLDDDDVFRHVAMHELGHVLGLDHSDACDRPGQGTLMKAVFMFPPLEAPQADDVEGAAYIYRVSTGGDGSVPSGVNSCAIAPAPSDRDVACPFLAILLLLALRRIGAFGRRRRRVLPAIDARGFALWQLTRGGFSSKDGDVGKRAGHGSH